MRTTILILVCTATAATTFAQRKVTIESMPGTTEEFELLRAEQATTPQGGAALYLLALYKYEQDRDMGMQWLVLMTEKSRIRQMNNKYSYKGYGLSPMDRQFIDRQLLPKPYIIRSYFPGATPENAYKNDDLPWEIRFTTNAYSGKDKEGTVKLYVASSGADRPRPMTVVRNSKGIWKVKEFSSVLSGIRYPVEEDDGEP